MIVAEVKGGELFVRRAGPKDLLEAVLILASLIPPGRVTSYGSVARALGISPRSAAKYLSLNREHIVVPCHRVVRANGEIGGYTPFGSDLKRKLLELEGVAIVDGRIPKEYFIDISKAFLPKSRREH